MERLLSMTTSQKQARTTPPSTRSAAPVIPEASGLQTKVTLGLIAVPPISKLLAQTLIIESQHEDPIYRNAHLGRDSGELARPVRDDWGC